MKGSDKAARRIELVRQGTSKIIARTIWLLITRKCPLACRHCYLCGSPDGESLTVGQVRKIVAHLPSGVESMGVSGGEPFTDINLLRETIRAIRGRDFPNLTNINVQTVGFWARRREYTKEVIADLIELGVNSFYVYGLDQWHWERGARRERQEMLLDVLKNEFGGYEPDAKERVSTILERSKGITYSVRATGPILPIGRAAWSTAPDERQVPKVDPICKCRPFLRLNPNGYLYTVNFAGEVHHCIYQIARPLGNLTERPLTTLLKNARRSKYFQLMDKGNIPDFGERFCGVPRSDVLRSIEEKGRCVTHFELLSRYFEGRHDRPVLHGVFESDRARYSRKQRRQLT